MHTIVLLVPAHGGNPGKMRIGLYMSEQDAVTERTNVSLNWNKCWQAKCDEQMTGLSVDNSRHLALSSSIDRESVHGKGMKAIDLTIQAFTDHDLDDMDATYVCLMEFKLEQETLKRGLQLKSNCTKGLKSLFLHLDTVISLE
jgi:hypothetical protein